MAQLLSRARGLVERTLHPWRRARARRRIRKLPLPRTVLVICLGNICRSPFAAALLQQRLAPSGTIVRSAGFLGPGRGAPLAGIEAAAERGVDLRKHRSRLAAPAVIERADLIVVMEGRQQTALRFDLGHRDDAIVVLGDLDPEPIRRRAIDDPVDRPTQDFAEVYARIERCVDALVTLLGVDTAGTRPPAAELTERPGSAMTGAAR